MVEEAQQKDIYTRLRKSIKKKTHTAIQQCLGDNSCSHRSKSCEEATHAATNRILSADVTV